MLSFRGWVGGKFSAISRWAFFDHHFLSQSYGILVRFWSGYYHRVFSETSAEGCVYSTSGLAINGSWYIISYGDGLRLKGSWELAASPQEGGGWAGCCAARSMTRSVMRIEVGFVSWVGGMVSVVCSYVVVVVRSRVVSSSGVCECEWLCVGGSV